MKTWICVFIACAAVWIVPGSALGVPDGKRDADYGSKAALHQYSEQETAILRSLWLGSLPPLPSDPSNRYSDNPEAARLGRKLFDDPRFSGNGKISCKTCHKPETTFTDNEPLAKGMGTTTRRNMPIIGLAYFKWYFWDGRADSLWSQALGPFENPVEHGTTRCRVALLVVEHYGKEYREVFGSIPDLTETDCPPGASPVVGSEGQRLWQMMEPDTRHAVNLIFSNIGKAIAAYTRLIIPTTARFDRYVEVLLRDDVETMGSLLNEDELAGMRLFIGKGKCTECHSGPLFSDGSFHNVKVPDRRGVPYDRGRADGIAKVLSDEFNCLGPYSDAEPAECIALNTLDRDSQKFIGAFKTPILRNVVERSPYMHAGQFKTIAKVMSFYQYPFDFHLDFDLGHAILTDRELVQIEAFLHTLSSPLNFP